MPLTIPNLLTLLRVALIPVFVIVFYLPFEWSHVTSGVIFALASFTDWLDGYLARLLKQTSSFGAFLDPVADKLIVVIALILLVGDNSLPPISLPVIIIIGREITVSALREWMAEIGQRASVAVNWIGKFKTAIQMLAVILLLAHSPNSTAALDIIGFILINIAAAMTLWSMILYIKAAWPAIVSQTETA